MNLTLPLANTPKFSFTRKQFYTFMKKHNLSFYDTAKAFRVYNLSALGKYLNNNKSRAKTIQLRKLKDQEIIQPDFIEKLF